MLFLLFQPGRDRYALDAGQIAEVLPLVDIKPLPRAPEGVAGVFDYRGTPVPVIDLSQLMLGRPAAKHLSTRIVLARYPDAGGVMRLLGLLAEQATQTVRRDPGDFLASGVSHDAAPYLGPVASDERGLIQWIEVHKLLPAAVREALFKP